MLRSRETWIAVLLDASDALEIACEGQPAYSDIATIYRRVKRAVDECRETPFVPAKEFRGDRPSWDDLRLPAQMSLWEATA
ncbi:MAG: hypothetical protein KGL39_51030 [Patescibacteria group bacterium]|nr:hypothetical protein [Patescibacteria group bacterium]